MPKKRKKGLNKEMRAQVKGILLMALAVFCYVGLFRTDQTGGIGLYVNNVMRSLAGEAAVIIPFMIAILALRLILPLGRHNVRTRLGGIFALQIIYMVWIHLQLIAVRIPYITSRDLFIENMLLGYGGEGGGLTGALFAGTFVFLIGAAGSLILIYALALISVLMIFDISLKKFFNYMISLASDFIDLLKKIGKSFFNIIVRISTVSQANFNNRTARNINMANRTSAVYVNESETPLIRVNETDKYSDDANTKNFDYQKERITEVKRHAETKETNMEVNIPVVPPLTRKLPVNYSYPSLDLLSLPRANGNQQHLKSSKNRAKLLENTLLSFGVKAKVVHVQSGPTVTRFEVQPEAGVKVSKIISLSDDLALNLAAPLVRIEAPIPGKAALGIEVPNNIITMVHLREVMEESAFQKSGSPLTVGLGKDITGIPVIADLTKMPHLLIAGATGAGKSVCLNTIITSILYKAGPEKVRFLMIDPKVVELSIYNGIPHLLMPVLTDPRKASLALRNMVREMARRYDLFASLGARDIATYNELAAAESELEKMSYIVVIIDELADLMLVSPGEVEDSIARLAQMSRAAGIHLLVATQRPSVDVLTGIIKANITSRIAFTVSSQFDSRTILDMAGAEKLLGSGDMLFYPVGAVKPFRVQGAFVSEDELKRVTDHLKKQGCTEYENGNGFMDTPDEVEEKVDSLFADAVDLVVRTGQASISLLQRRFRIGYTRAARLIDDLERRGIVGPFEGSKPREVLVTAELAAQICKDYNRKNS